MGNKICHTKSGRFFLSGCWDSNPESPVPKTGMLAVTPHPDAIFLSYHIFQ